LVYLLSLFFILKTKYALERHLFIGTFSDMFNARWQFFISTRQGEVLNTFTREMSTVTDAFGHMGLFFASIFHGIIFAIVPFIVSWKVTSISLISGIIFALPFTLFGRLSYKLGILNTKTANQIGTVLQENVGAAKIVLGFGNAQSGVTSLSQAFDEHRRATIKSQTIDRIITQLYGPCAILVLIITVLAGKKFALPMSSIAMIVYSFLKITPVIGQITTSKNSMENFFPSYEQVMGLRKRARQLVQKTGARKFIGFQRDILLENVFFSYPDHEPVLKGINARIPKGKMVAFVGGSGVGKSTLIDIIMGFNEPQSGSITIDDIHLKDFNIISYRRRIGYVPQESVLFNMTIRKNLLWAYDKASSEDIEKVCREAHATEFINSFPDGYDTLVGERGVRLSGGQLQRIALARSLLRKPEILILDEATSSLDTHSEKLIQRAIEEVSQETTVIVIAHRLSTIVNADYIYVLDDGRVVEEGTYLDLVQKQGLFSKMVNIQILEAPNSNNDAVSTLASER
jgi:ATP-binding cassette subfamily B protein